MDLRDQLQATLGDSYRLGRELGGGGMARVFVAAASVTPAGYSGKQTWEKLGFKAGQSIVVIDAPSDYAKLIGGLPTGAKTSSRIVGAPEMVHVFATEKKLLSRHLKALRTTIAQDGTIWVSWPKKAAKVETDITEDVIRDVALPMGLVDVKVCAVSEIWSGLKLVIRKTNRR